MSVLVAELIILIFIFLTIARVLDCVTAWRLERMKERMDTIEKRLDLLLQASELQHTMIASDRDDLDRILKAFHAQQN